MADEFEKILSEIASPKAQGPAVITPERPRVATPALVAPVAPQRQVTPQEWKRMVHAAKSILGASPSQSILESGDALPQLENLRAGDGMVDDFQAFVQRMREAEVDEDGNAIDEFYGKAKFRKQLTKQLTDTSAPQLSAPVSALSALLGSSQTVQYIYQNQTSGQGVVVPLAYWAGEDGETRPITVTIAPVGQPPPANVVVTRLVGRVSFGTQAFQTQFDFDIGLGVQFVVSGSAVTVSAYMEQVQGIKPVVATGTLSQQAVAGMISFQAARRVTQLYRTVTATSVIPGNGSANFVVPAWASAVWVFRQPSASMDMTLQFLDQANDITYDAVFAANAQMTQPIPLAGGVTNMNVNSVAGGVPCVVWVLNA